MMTKMSFATCGCATRLLSNETANVDAIDDPTDSNLAKIASASLPSSQPSVPFVFAHWLRFDCASPATQPKSRSASIAIDAIQCPALKKSFATEVDSQKFHVSGWNLWLALHWL